MLCAGVAKAYTHNWLDTVSCAQVQLTHFVIIASSHSKSGQSRMQTSVLCTLALRSLPASRRLGLQTSVLLQGRLVSTQTAGFNQTLSLPMSAQLVDGPASTSQPPFRPLTANGQHALETSAPASAAPLTKQAPSHKRGRAALAEQQAVASQNADIATSTMASAEYAEATAKPKRRQRQTKAAAAVKQEQTDQQAEALSDVGMLSDATTSAQPAAKPKRKPRQTKAAAVKKEDKQIVSTQAESALETEVASADDGQSILPAARPKRKPTQTKAAAAAAVEKEEEQIVGNQAESASDTEMASLSVDGGQFTLPAANPKRKPRQTKEAAAAAATKKEQPAADTQLQPASHTEVPSHVSALESADTGQSAQPSAVGKTKPLRKPRQTKAAAAAAAAAPPQDDNAAVVKTEAPPAAKLDRRKRAKIETVVADVSEAGAKEAAEQDPAVVQAPVSGIDEHKPRKVARAARKAPAPDADADGNVSMSHACEESDAVVKVLDQGKGAPHAKKALAFNANASGNKSEMSEGELQYFRHCKQ